MLARTPPDRLAIECKVLGIYPELVEGWFGWLTMIILSLSKDGRLTMNAHHECREPLIYSLYNDSITIPQPHVNSRERVFIVCGFNQT